MPTRDYADADPRLVAKVTAATDRFNATFRSLGYEARAIEVFRSAEEQMVAFKANRSRFDGVQRKSKHNTRPTHAIDFGVFRLKDGAYIDNVDGFDRAMLVALYWSLGQLFQRFGLRWGGDWDNDGLLVVPDPDESLNDMPHAELPE
jgi:hypothetical protein